MGNQNKVPYIGALVVFHPSDGDAPAKNNYAKEIPAIVSAVFSSSGAPPFYANLKCLPDGPGTLWRTSIPHQDGIQGAVFAQSASWRWPEEELKRGVAPMGISEE